MITLPPQPKPEDFQLDGVYQYISFNNALAAWERVCNKIVETEKK